MRFLVGHVPLNSPAAGESQRLSAYIASVVPSAITRYSQYSKERFSLKQFVPLSIVISGLAAFGTQAHLYGRLSNVPAVIASFAAVFFLLLRLRLVDELKDLEHDRSFYQGRPVARGLVQPREVAQVAAMVFFLEVLVATTGGTQSLASFAIVTLYSFLTLKEFFVRKWLRRHFTAYVVSHEVLVLPVCFYLYSLNGLTLPEVMQPYFYLLTAFIAGHLFLLEVTRKLRPKELDKASQDTYTARYGIVNSCILSGFLALWVTVTGILTIVLGSRIANLGYISLALLGPVVFSLLTFIRRPDRGTAQAVLNWCVVLVVGTGALFILTVWFVL